jgi:hypothetical protein
MRGEAAVLVSLDDPHVIRLHEHAELRSVESARKSAG